MATAPLAIGGYGPTLLAVLWVEFFVAFALLLARIYTTWRITRRVRLDLYLTLLTFVRMAITLVNPGNPG